MNAKHIRDYSGASDYLTDAPALFKTITVTAEDRARGHQTSCFTCPVARAIKREYPNLEPLVGTQFAFLQGLESDDDGVHKTKYIAVIPDTVREFIYSFDHIDYTQTKLPEPFVLDFYERKI